MKLFKILKIIKIKSHSYQKQLPKKEYKILKIL